MSNSGIVSIEIAWEGKVVRLQMGMDLVRDTNLFARYLRNVIDALDGVKL